MGSTTWTPPQFSKPALTIITVPAKGNPVLASAPIVSGSGSLISAPVYQGGTPAINYVFDAVMRLSHKRRLVKTQHPVLTGANISDHAYLLPARLVMDIGMSDAMASFTSGIWVGSSTKSISAYQILKGLQTSKTLVTITTRLDTYYNMLLEDLDAPDTNKTLHGLRATICFGEILAASVSSQSPPSSRPQTTGNTSGGTIQSTPPSPAQIEQNALPSTLWPDTPTYPNVPGAGSVSSNNLGQVPFTPYVGS